MGRVPRPGAGDAGPVGRRTALPRQAGAVLAGRHQHTDTVVIRFPDATAVASWYDSPAYQALIPLREQAADLVLVSFTE